MNRIQEAIVKVTGVDSELHELTSALEQVSNDNRMMARQLEDIDYLNIYDFGAIREIIPSSNRREYIDRLRRLRHENPIAKQSVNLTLRFTLGKGIQYVVTEEVVEPEDLLGPNGEAPENPNTPPQLKKFLKKPGDAPPPPSSKPPAAAAATSNTPTIAIKVAASEAFPPPNGTKPAPTAPVPPNGTKPGEPPDPESDPEAPSDESPTPPRSTNAPAGAEDPVNVIVTEFWNDDDNKVALTDWESMKEWLDAVYTDGEYFFVGFESSAAPYLKLTELPLDEIRSIVYDPDNRKRPVYYLRVYRKLKYDGDAEQYVPDGEPIVKYYPDWRLTDEKLTELKKRLRIPPKKLAADGEKVYHARINPLWTKSGKRGVSELYASRQWFRVFREFMENRAAINEAATSIAFKRKIKAGPTGVAQFKGKLGGLDVGYDNPNNTSEVRKLTRPVPGATYDSNPAVDLDWMKTDTGAANAKEDASMLLAVGGAGVGTMMHYFGQGGDANLATAQSMELPMVKAYEDWQQFVNATMMNLTGWVLRLAQPDDWQESLKRVSFLFPPIISQDVVKYLTAWGQLVSTVAPDNHTAKMQAIRGSLSVLNVNNIDRLMALVEDEEEVNRAKKDRDKARMAAINPLNPLNPSPPMVGDGKNPIQDGNGNVLPPDLQTVAAGNPQPIRTGLGGRIQQR